MQHPTLIYCADGNKRFAGIAINQGYTYGAQLPNTVYFAPDFIDQKWRDPKRAVYMETLSKHRPALASVLDWERQEQLSEVLDWAEEAAQYVTDSVIVIPKVVNGIKQLPRMVGGKPLRLGYSASTTFSKTPVSLGDFRGWPVHCLGGSVATQMYVARTVGAISVDGNYLQRMAREFGEVYSPAVPDKHRGMPRLSRFCGHRGNDSIYIAFELSCIGAQMAWKGHRGTDIYEAQIAWLEAAGLPPQQKQMALISAS